MEKDNFTGKYKGDKTIWTIFFFLCAISLVEVFSASSTLSFRSGNYTGPFLKHLGILIIGIGTMIATMNVKCKYFKCATIIYPFVLLALLLVLILGESTNGAQRWLSFLGFQFQPSEIAKGVLVLITAQILSAMQTEKGTDKRAFTWILWFSAPVVILIALENLSTALILSFVIFMLMFIGKVPWSQLGKLLGVTFICVSIFISAIMLLGKDTKAVEQNAKNVVVEQTLTPKKKSFVKSIFHRFDTWKSRIIDFLDKKDLKPEEVDLVGKGAQGSHANIAIASSNVIGRGPGNSVERDFLSQAFSDFIFAIIIEEMGIPGAGFVCLLYITLLFRASIIANRCANTFPALLVMGIALLLVAQAMFNMAVAVGLAPVTGQPLPLISKGGTSTIVNCVYIGIILSVSHSAKKKDEDDADKELALA